MVRPRVPRQFEDYRRHVREQAATDDTHEAPGGNSFLALLEWAARQRGMRVIPQQRIRVEGPEPICVDAEVRDPYNIGVGIMDSKRRRVDVADALRAKIADGYPTLNLLVENTREAILIQDDAVLLRYALDDWAQVDELLSRFLTHRSGNIARFYQAAEEFNQRLPQLAQGLQSIIDAEKRKNGRLREALDAFLGICREAVNPGMRMDEAEDLLRQHLLMKRILESVFQNPDFMDRNPIARALKKIVDELRDPYLSIMELLNSVEWFYRALDEAARAIPNYERKQEFLHGVYERFFQVASARTADTHGIVYTPAEVVRWMVRSADAVMRDELALSLLDPGVHVLDPCTGTGKFIQEVLRYLSGYAGAAGRSAADLITHKYLHDIHCNEVLLLPYYIAAQNIEHEYYERFKRFEAFPGICFADTLEMAKTQFSFDLDPTNAHRMQQQELAPIHLIIGNPPYNVGQQNENDDNRNRRYGELDERIKSTYGRASSASSTAKLYDMYVRFFRWATDRLAPEGVICFITNSGFLDKGVFDGMRREMLREFSDIYVLDLGGDVRDHPALSGTLHNVFGIKVGVAITLLVRKRREGPPLPATVRYARTEVNWLARQKLDFLREHPTYDDIEWTVLQPDERGNWLTTGMSAGFDAFMPMGSKEAKAGKAGADEPVFRTFSIGVNTNRDAWVYNHSREALLRSVRRLTDTYNADLGRWMAAGRPRDQARVEALLTRDDTRIKWSSHLRDQLTRGTLGTVDESHLRRAMYRPFASQWLYYGPLVIHRPGQFGAIYPSARAENLTICLTDAGSEKPFMVLATNRITDLHLVGAGAGTQCFPLYLYGRDGERTENVGRAALAEYRRRYGAQVTARDVFDYVYALLHSGEYRDRFAENLKRGLPRIPFVPADDFGRWVRAGHALVNLHASYEEADPYPLEEHFAEKRPISYHVERMKLQAEQNAVVVNRSLTLRGLPDGVFRYELAGKTALEWVINQYQVKRDARSGIVSDPNDPEDEKGIVRLVKQVVTVSVESMRIIDELPELAIAQ
jgi:predicted helicase